MQEAIENQIKRTQSEVFLEELSTTENVIYAAPGAQIDPRLLALQQTWT
jgi:hypothetical protein